MGSYKDLKLDKFKDTTDITDVGTAGTKIATGTTAQRGSTTGQLRYNTTTDRFEGKNASGVTEIFATPSVTSVDDVEVDSGAGGNQTFVITGANFATGDVASFVGNDGTTVTASSTTVNSATQITAVIAKSSFVNSKEPYDIKITNSTNQFGTLNNIINVDNPVAWQTTAGNLGTINHDVNATHFTLSCTDPDGDTVTYSEVGNNLSASGLSLNTSTGALSGDPTDQSVGASTTYSFTIRGTANSKTSDRAFNIIVQNPAPFIVATGGAISYDGDYKIHTFPHSTTADTNTSTDFVLSHVGSDGTYGNKIWYLLIAGGGGTSEKGGNTTGLGLTAFGGGVGSQSGGAKGDGGSGGGGRGDSSITPGSGTSGQGNNGGAGYDPHPEGAGGGGGAGGSGSTGRSGGNATGGAGLANSITGSSVTYAGGGGGGNHYSCGAASGGSGGGGTGGQSGQCGPSNATNGSDGKGGGAGGWGSFGGGGGAGGMLTNGATATYDFTVTAQTYTIVVGGGGSGSAKGGAGTAIIRYKYQ